LRRRAQGGAALLMALLSVALIVSLAGSMVWLQQRAIEVESAERARADAGWILLGALDWSRLILREDGRSSRIDHAGEPWATPLAEARLSTFLAADGQSSLTADDGPQAFLSGSVVDAQAKYNLRNLVSPQGLIVPEEQAVLSRLCVAAGLPQGTAGKIAEALVGTWGLREAGTPLANTKPVPIRRYEQLTWLGLEPGTVAALQASADILPSPTPINVNTAPREVLAAVLNVDLGVAERIAQHRQRNPFANLEELRALLPQGPAPDSRRAAVNTTHFLVRGRLRLDERVLEEQSLVMRRGSGGGTEVITLHRERRSLQLSSGAPAS
jgi:general secretion pathway protein K